MGGSSPEFGVKLFVFACLLCRVPGAVANKWLLTYDNCDSEVASSAVVVPMDVCVQTELHNFQKQTCQVDASGTIYVQTSFWQNHNCRGTPDIQMPTITHESGCDDGELWVCSEGDHTRAITHWPAVAKYKSLTGSCGTWADEVVAFNPNCTVGSDQDYRRSVCREKTLLYAEYGPNCTSTRSTAILEKYRTKHCSTSLSVNGPDAANDVVGRARSGRKGRGGDRSEWHMGLGRDWRDGWGDRDDDGINRWMYYASCDGARALPGVISPNDNDDGDSDPIPEWEVVLIVCCSILVLFCAVRVGVRLQGANQAPEDERQRQYSLLHDEGLDKVRGADTHNDPRVVARKEGQYNASPSFDGGSPSINIAAAEGHGSYAPPATPATPALYGDSPSTRGKELVTVRSSSAERAAMATPSSAAPVGAPLGTDEKSLKKISDMIHTPV